MKKLLSIILALVLLFSLTITAFADPRLGGAQDYGEWEAAQRASGPSGPLLVVRPTAVAGFDGRLKVSHLELQTWWNDNIPREERPGWQQYSDALEAALAIDALQQRFTSLVLPENTQVIGELNLDTNYRHIKTVILPASVVEVRPLAFWPSYYPTITELVVPSSVTNFRDAFNLDLFTKGMLHDRHGKLMTPERRGEIVHSNLVIYCTPGSAAETYAKTYGIKYDSYEAYFNPAIRKYTPSTPTVAATSLTATITGERVDATKAVFDRWYTNTTRAINLTPEGVLAAPVRVSVSGLSFTGMDTASLVFYMYNRTENKIARISEPAYRIENGVLSFVTPAGGDIVISNGVLVRKAS